MWSSKYVAGLQHGRVGHTAAPQHRARQPSGLLIYAVAYRRDGNSTPLRQRLRDNVPHAPPAPRHQVPDSTTHLSTSSQQPVDVVGQDDEQDAVPSPTGLAASTGMILGLVLVLGGVYLGREQIHEFVDFFITVVESYGMWGYLAYALVYCLLVRTLGWIRGWMFGWMRGWM